MLARLEPQEFSEPAYAAKPMRSQWYAVHLRSNFEKKIASELAGKGVHTYLPVYDEVHQWKDRKQRVQVPLFSGYVFVQMSDSPQSRRAVLQTSGVVQILGSGGRMEPVPDEQIQAIELLLATGVSCVAHPFLHAGSWVRVRRGPLRGLEGILVRHKNTSRLVISVPLLAQSVATELDSRDVEPIDRSRSAKFVE